MLRARSKLFADETTVPVLDPGRGRTKTGQLWAYADDRRWGGLDPAGIAYVYATDRKAERLFSHLAGFKGVLQVDGYNAYPKLAERGEVELAFCRVGGDVASPPSQTRTSGLPASGSSRVSFAQIRHIDGRSWLTAADVARAWPGSATTADCCGGHAVRAISSTSA